MKTLKLPDQAVLHEIFSYDPETGLLRWKARPTSMFSQGPRQNNAASSWNSRHAGKIAFTSLNTDGYLHGQIFGQMFRAHRVIFKMCTGIDAVTIDHINRNPRDNRISNLREVPHSENMKNKSNYKSNHSGVAGVYWNNTKRLWSVQISIDKKQTHLGYFKSFDEAVLTRREAESMHGYYGAPVNMVKVPLLATIPAIKEQS